MPESPVNPEALMEDWKFLREVGVSYAEACRRVGVSESWVEKQLRLERKEG